jgi:hypothetical protein
MRRTPLLLIALPMTLAAAPSAPPLALPPRPAVEIHLLTPQGTPAANREVTVTSLADGRPPLSLRTDAAGILRFDAPAGAAQFAIAVPGLGHGCTGIVRVDPAAPALVPLPPLAPYSHLAGTLPAPLLHSGLSVELIASANRGRDTRHLQTDDNGRFETDLPAGEWTLTARDAHDVPRAAAGPLTTHPGQTSTVALAPVPPPPDPGRPVPWRKVSAASLNQPTTWAEGALTDTAGHPLAGATIYVAATFPGGHRGYENAAQATTDAAGHYRVSGDGRPVRGTLLAVAPGHAPAWATFENADAPIVFVPADAPVDTLPAPAAVPRIDLALSSHPGRLDVKILHNGSPAVGTTVIASLEGLSLRNPGILPDWSTAGPAIAATTPTALTDNTGAAHFTGLLPGTYHLIAADLFPGDLHRVIEGRASLPANSADASGIPVRPDALATTSLALAAPPAHPTLRLLDHTGKPLAGPVAYGARHLPQHADTMTSIPFTDGSLDPRFLDDRGWYAWTARYPASANSGAAPEPFFEAAGFLPSSNWLPRSAPFTVQAQARNPGNLRVRIADADAPLRGVASLVSYHALPDMTGSLDPRGEILFTAVPTAPCTVAADLPEFAIPLTARADVPRLPEDAALLHRRAILPVTLTPRHNTTDLVELHPEPVGYIRGIVHQPPDGSMRTVDIRPAPEQEKRGALVNRNPAGEFVAGPFPVGTAHLQFITYATDGPHVLTRDLPVSPDRVATLSVALPAEPLAPPTAAAALHGKIFLPDNTPANGARVFLLRAGESTPAYSATTDAAGILHPRSLDRAIALSFPTTPSALVAFLPGNHGGVLLSPVPTGDLAITLPPPRSVKGRITLGGSPLASRPAHLHIRAAFQNPSPLAHYLDIDTTADADGNFELAGLSPGTYRVQASLDDVSFSPTLTLIDTPDAPLALDIPLPSAPLTLQLSNPDGSPRAGAAVTLSTNDGPLADTLAPHAWTTDANGALLIPTADAGPHTLTLPGTSLRQTLTLTNQPQEISLTIP